MTQTKISSLAESVANAALGLPLSLVVNWATLTPMMAAAWSAEAIAIAQGAVFFCVAVARNYAVRRQFNSNFVLRHWRSR